MSVIGNSFIKSSIAVTGTTLEMWQSDIYCKVLIMTIGMVNLSSSSPGVDRFCLVTAENERGSHASVCYFTQHCYHAAGMQMVALFLERVLEKLETWKKNQIPSAYITTIQPVHARSHSELCAFGQSAINQTKMNWHAIPSQHIIFFFVLGCLHCFFFFFFAVSRSLAHMRCCTEEFLLWLSEVGTSFFHPFISFLHIFLSTVLCLELPLGDLRW